MICNVIPCYVTLCSVILCTLILCSVILRNAVLCKVTTLCSVILCSVILCCIILCSVILCSVIQCSVILRIPKTNCNCNLEIPKSLLKSLRHIAKMKNQPNSAWTEKHYYCLDHVLTYSRMHRLTYLLTYVVTLVYPNGRYFYSCVFRYTSNTKTDPRWTSVELTITLDRNTCQHEDMTERRHSSHTSVSQFHKESIDSWHGMRGVGWWWWWW